MSPNRITSKLVREAPRLQEESTVEEAVRAIVDSGLPALPVVDDQDRLVGVFGEREFMTALFPGYVGELRYAGFIPKRLDETLEKRAACRQERVAQHMNREHVDVPVDASDVHVAEMFLHHRVLILPAVGPDGLEGVITRSDFFAELARRFLEA